MISYFLRKICVCVYVCVSEGGKWEVGSYVTGSEVREREWGAFGSGVYFPLFPVFCSVSACSATFLHHPHDLTHSHGVGTCVFVQAP